MVNNNESNYFLKKLVKTKLFIVCFLISSHSGISINSYSQVSLFTFNYEEISVKEILDNIEKTSEFVFFFYDNVLDINRKVTINTRNQTIDKVLNQLFEGTDNTYVINDRQIFITKKENSQIGPELPSDLQSKNIIKGSIVDEFDDPLPGAAVIIQGSTRGVTTDLDGTFEIEAAPTDKLVVSYLGMQDQIVEVGNQKNLFIKLSPKVGELEEVTVIAYGTQKKESIIGAISTVSVNDLRIPTGKISNSLAGQMAGLVSLQRSGEPGGGSDFWIRGVNTFGANNRPLILVDGIERDLDLVDTEDIESFSILKDATATAVYGVKGANGVVLVTTRKGKEGKPVVSARVESGFLSPVRLPKMANAEQFINLYNDVYSHANNGALFYSEEDKRKYLSGEDPDLYPNVDWMKEIYKSVTTSQRVNINVTGGAKNVRYYVAGSVYRENGVFDAEKGDQYNPSLNWTKYNFRSNIDIDLSSSTILSLNLSTQYDIKNEPNTASGTLFVNTYQTIPIAIPKIYSDGTLAKPDVGGINPYNNLNHRGYKQIFNNNAQSLVSLTQDFSEMITPGLKANVKVSFDAINRTILTRSKNPVTYYATGRDENGNLEFLNTNTNGSNYLSLGKENAGERVLYIEASGTYDRIFNEIHRVGGLFLFNMREKVNNFPSNYINALPYRNMGIAARATYSFKDRYFIEGNFGYNGSENFAPGKRFGFFPSIALGYLISNEDFFQPITPVISMLKFRGSHGTIGNDEIGGDRRFAFNAEMLDGSGSYTFGQTGGNYISGVATGYPGNPDVSWEKAIKTDIGIELELFNSFKIYADYFQEKRDGIFILRESVPSIVGVNVNPYVNLGKMSNKGIDLTLEYYKMVGNVNLSARGTFTYNRNKKLYDDKATPIYEYLDPIGKPLYQQFGLLCIGLFQSEEEIANSPVQEYGNVYVGDRKYKDINGDGVINDYDKVAIGRTHVPEINYGFGLSAIWKGLDVSIFFQGVGNVTNWLDGDPINGFESGTLWQSNVFRDYAVNRWTENNTHNDIRYPRMYINVSQNNKQLSNAKQYDASFFRIKSMEIGYALPRKWLQKTGLSTFRVYVQGMNLLTFSSFKLWDVELNNSQGGVYPNMRTINLGINVNF